MLKPCPRHLTRTTFSPCPTNMDIGQRLDVPPYDCGRHRSDAVWESDSDENESVVVCLLSSGLTLGGEAARNLERELWAAADRLLPTAMPKKNDCNGRIFARAGFASRSNGRGTGTICTSFAMTVSKSGYHISTEECS